MAVAKKKSGGGPATSARTRDLESEVAARTEELSSLSAHLQTSVEAERSALAKLLHDELGGMITAAKMDMAWLNSRIGKDLDAESHEKFQSVVQMLNQAMVLKRRVVESLRPSLLDHFGLAVALRSYFDEQCSRAGIEYVGTLPEEPLELSPEAQLVLFRVAQDALNNVFARGGARHVELVLEPAGQDGATEGYLLEVGDDGETLNANTARTTLGMRQRIQGIGGNLEVEIAPGKGTRVRAFAPQSPTGSG
jgi:signal transduction histidine kinase